MPFWSFVIGRGILGPVDAAQARAGELFSRRSLASQVIGLAWPAVIEQLLGLTVSLINTYLVGHLGAAALAAVGLSGQLRMLMMGLFSAVGVGSTALVARHVGAREPEGAEIIAAQSLLLAVVVGLLAVLPCVVWGDALLAILGAAEDVVALGGAYMVAVGTTMPLMAILFIGNATLRGAGDTRTPMLVMRLVNLINGGVSCALVRGLGPLPAYGVLGAGVGSAVGVGVGRPGRGAGPAAWMVHCGHTGGTGGPAASSTAGLAAASHRSAQCG